MQTNQLKVFVITLANNTTWLVFTNNQQNARDTIAAKVIALRMFSNPDTTVWINDTSNLVNSASIYKMSPDDITEQSLCRDDIQ